MENNDYLSANKASWNTRTEVHFDSEFYDNDGFVKGNTSLNTIELDLLGDVTGKSILHLQCHFGQDTLSLNRMGAQVTGVDLSDKAIEKANELKEKTGTEAEFICCDVYSLPDHLEKRFDYVYTSYGTIGWLPDLDRWAKVINHFLKPGGQFLIVEFHPVVWMFDDDFQFVQYPYLKADPIVEETEGTYADTGAPIKTKTVSWNHGLSEVVNSLVQNGLSIDLLNEYDYSPYQCFRHLETIGPKQYRIKHLGDKLPMVYALQATKR